MLRSPASIFVLIFGIVVVFVGVSSRLLATTLEQTLTQRLQHELTRVGQLVEAVVRQRGPSVEWDALADELGKELDTRVTLISSDGAVIGDSSITFDNLQRLENHAERPEVAVAREGKIGFSVRYSASVSERLAYVALPLRSREQAATAPAKALSVIRIARDASDIETIKHRVELSLVLGGGLALSLVALAMWATNRLRDERVHTLRSALKHSPDRLREFFADDSPEQKLARTLQENREQTREALFTMREQIGRQHRILEGMQEGVLVLDADAKIAFINRALREMLLLGQEVMGKPLIEVVRNAELAAIVERTRSEAAPQSGELETAGIKPRLLLVQTSPLEDAEHSLVAVFVDVTDVRRLESLRRDFVANVSHELRTPVTAIKSATETLRSIEGPADSVRFLDIVDRNAQRLADLVEDLLDLSRIESKAYKLTLEPLALSTVTAYSLSLFKERADKKRLQLEATVSQTLPPVRADRRALEQVLTNLIDNAVKYCPEGARIALSAEEQGTSLRIIVRDTGPGIEQKHLPRLFERFYRVDAGRARDTGGTGLGLSIAKHLVEAMDGTIGVESKPGSGTTFFLSLPKA